MDRISVYDIEAKKIEEFTDKHDITEPEMIQAMFEALEDNNINLEDYI